MNTPECAAMTRDEAITELAEVVSGVIALMLRVDQTDEDAYETGVALGMLKERADAVLKRISHPYDCHCWECQTWDGPATSGAADR